MLFDHPDFDRHAEVAFFDGGIVIAIHRVGPLGTSGGGCRIWPYDDEDAAVADALRLSRAMSYKLALLELPVGGAKAVVLAREKSQALLRRVGRAVESLKGRFVIGEDVGTDPADLALLAEETRWVTRHSADTSEATAEGVLVCLKHAVQSRLGRARLEGLRIAVQGLGRVGSRLAMRLRREGAHLVVADLDPRRVEAAVRELGATAATPEGLFDEEFEVLSPCALGGVLDPRRVERLRCAVVVGAANAQLAEPGVAETLAARGILYVPDFLANAGGVLGDPARVERLGALFETIFDRAAASGATLHAAAEELARERCRALGGEL